MKEGDSRPRLLRALLGILALAGVGVLTFVGGVRRAETRGWAEMDLRCRKLGAEAQYRPFTRKVLRGPPEPGNAWDAYLQAFALASRAAKTGIERAEQVDAIFEHLRRGTQRSEVRTPVSPDPKGGWTFPRPMLDALWGSGLFRSRRLAADGDIREAVEVLLDLYLLGADFCRNGNHDLLGAGSELRRKSLDELRPLILQKKLAKDALEDIERQMEVLDEAAPDPAATLLNQTLLLGGNFLREEESWETMRTLMEYQASFDWRHAFSKRLFMIDAFREVDDWNRRAAEVTRKPWPEAHAVHLAISAESGGRGTPFPSLGIDSWAWAAWVRASDAKVRLLRCALHFQRTGDLLTLEDPFGGDLRHEAPEKGRMRLWSLGAHGDGEPNAGGWSHPNHPGETFLTIDVDRYP